jgi:DNA-binding beta-propeller fold protein YncE
MTLADLGRRMTWAALLALAIAVGGCGEDDIGDDLGGDAPAAGNAGVYLLNEGLFDNGNSSLWFYDATTGDVAESVFAEANGRPLGDTANDMALNDGKLWIVVNNSQTIEVLDAATRVSAATIEFASGGSPTTITFDDSGKAYVPLRGGDALARIDTTSMTQDADPVEVGANPHEAVFADGKVYVTNSGFGSGTTVSAVDVATFTITSVIEVGNNPTAVVNAGGGRVVVLASGVSWADPPTPGAVVVIDTATDTVVNSIPLDSGASDRMEMGPDGIAYFLTPGAVARFDVSSQALTADFITAAEAGAGAFYGLSVNRESGAIYVSDAKDYASAGEVYVFAATGAAIRSFGSDLLPRVMAFVGDASDAELLY